MNRARANIRGVLAIAALLAACAPRDLTSPIQVLSPTPSATQTATEATPAATVTNPAPEPFLLGEIWYWKYTGVRSEFGRLPEGTFERLGVVPMTLPNGSPSPRAGFDFDFDRYGRGIAYLTNTDVLRLWVSNLDLQGAVNAWTDEYAWLGNPTAYEEVDLRWGPGDRSILIVRDRRILVHSLSSGDNTRFEGECAELGVSSDGIIALLCSGAVPGTPPGLFALTPDGSFGSVAPGEWTTVSGVVEWAFSPGRDQVLFATSDLKIRILSSDGIVRDLPITYFPSSAPTLENTRELQWSADGSRLLILGVPAPNSPCAAGEDHDIALPCWMVLDLTGLIVWTAGAGGPDAADDASLSPDGRWIVGSSMRLADRFGRVVSLVDGTTIDVYLGLLDKVRWVE